MNLNELFNIRKKLITEGGNVSSQSPGWQGAADQAAEEIDLKIHNRDFMVGQLRTLLAAQNENFKAAYGKYIWDPKLLASGKMFSGSSLQFFDVKGVNTQDFINKLKKTKVGDIDTQIDQDMGDEVTAWLKSIIGKKVGNGTFLGFNSSLSSIWLLDDPQVRIQVDYELGPYDAKTKSPTEWFAYSHSSHYDDMAAGIKGVFHKYINRALTHAQATEKYVARVLKKGVKISDEPVTDSDYSFAVSSAQGGGMSIKYKPYIDPATGQPMEKDGIPVMQLLDPKDRDYIQNLDQQFQMTYGRKRGAADKNLQGSFVGTLQLMNKSFSPEQNDAVARAFLDILFGPGAQMITKDDPARDRDVKFAAVDGMLLGGDGIKPLNLPNGQGLRQEAVKMAMDYADKFNAKKTGAAAAGQPTAESLSEAEEVKAQFRKNMPHLRDLKPADLLDLIDEIHDGNGNFKLQNIPLNVKVDGFGGRFGKDAEGKPFMATSNTPPRYAPSFVKYHQEKGTTDPEILGRAQNFDKLFLEMMNAIKLVDSKLGPEFLVNKQVTCEVLFLPFATETPEGKLKFVGIHYDRLPDGIQLALVPFRVVDATSGEDIPDAQSVVKQLTGIGKQGSVMFIDNSLTQKEGLDVTAIVPPVENIEQIKSMLASGKLAQKREAKEILAPVALALEKAIQEDPNILGKDLLGQDYEGIVINSRLGPIKVTSSQQKKIIADKQAAKAAARTEQPRTGNKTAVVAIGSFVGHKGHQQLFGLTINKAKEVSGDPYLFMGNAVGVDDPIPVADKIKTWKQLYPEYAANIGAVTQEGGSLMQKIKHELINPLPGKPPRYDNVIIMVGEDQAKMPIAQALMKAVNKFPGYEHVKVQLEVTPRGTGMSFTKLRNVLKTGNEQQAFQMWNDAFNGGQDGAKPLPAEWIKHLMDVSMTGMSTPQPKSAVKKPAVQPTPQPVQQPALGEMRLFNALMLGESRKGRKKINRAAYGPGPYGWYGYDAGYSGDGGGGESIEHENFADGRNPQDKGDSKRHGVPTKSSVSNLRKVAKQGGRKGQLAHWMANMKSGKAKAKNEEFSKEYDDEAGMAQSNLRTMARAVDGLLKTIKNNDNLPEWGQEKIAKAEMMLVSVWDYLQSQKELGMDPKVNESRALGGLRQIVAELSSEKLGQYKKAAGAQASAADKAGDTKKADKRFSGIVKATKKQFANDEKKTTEANVKTPQSYNKPRWWDDLPAKERDQFFRSQGNLKSASAPKKNEKGVAEGDRPGMKDGRPYSDPLRRHPGNDSYMTPEYLIQKYQDELKKIAAGPYKRPKDVAMYKARIAKLQRQQGVAEGEKQSKSKEMDLDWHYKNIINTKGLSDKAKKDTTDIYNKLKKNKEQGVAEADSNAMSDTAKRLANKDDGKVAKLRAAGDKRREEELKGRNIAKRNEAMLPKSTFTGSDKNKLAPQGQLKGTAPKKQPTHKLVGENKCVPIGEAYEVEMALAILKLFEGKR